MPEEVARRPIGNMKGRKEDNYPIQYCLWDAIKKSFASSAGRLAPGDRLSADLSVARMQDLPYTSV
jgi:hypothetical protein